MIGVRICYTFAGIMGGKLSPVVVSVSKQVVNDVNDSGMIRFAARPPKVDDILQARRNQPLECLAVLFKTLEKLRFAEHREHRLRLLFTCNPFEPDPFAHHHMTQQFLWSSLRIRSRIDKLYPLTIPPYRVLHEPEKFAG